MRANLVTRRGGQKPLSFHFQGKLHPHHGRCAYLPFHERPDHAEQRVVLEPCAAIQHTEQGVTGKIQSQVEGVSPCLSSHAQQGQPAVVTLEYLGGLGCLHEAAVCAVDTAQVISADETPCPLVTALPEDHQQLHLRETLREDVVHPVRRVVPGGADIGDQGEGGHYIAAGEAVGFLDVS